MACSSIRLRSDAANDHFVALGGPFPADYSMKHVFSKPSRWYVAFGPCTWHGRRMNCQAVAVEETEIKEICESKFRRWQTDETRVLIAAKKQQDVRKLESIEKAGSPLTRLKSDWKDIETFCKQKGVQRSADQCKSRWSRLMLTYIQIQCWERKNTSEHLSYWSMMPDEKKATGVLLSNLDQSIYNMLDGIYRDEVADCGDEHKLFAESLQLPLKEASEVMRMEVNASISHQQASEQVSACIADKHVSTDGNLTLAMILEDTNAQSVSAEVACEKQVVHTTDAMASIELGHKYKSTQIEYSSAEMGSSYEKETQQIVELAASADQTCESQITTNNRVIAGVEAQNEFQTQHSAGKETVKGSSAVGNRIFVVKGQTPEEILSFPSMECQKLDTAVENDALQISQMVSMQGENGGGLPNQRTSLETTWTIQSEQVAGGKVSQSTPIKVRLYGVEESAASEDQTCEGQRASGHRVLAGVEACKELPTQGTVDKEMLKGNTGAGNTICGGQEQSPEKSHFPPSLGCPGLDASVEYHTLQSSKVVPTQERDGEGSPNQGTSVKASRMIQSEQVGGGEGIQSTSIEVDGHLSTSKVCQDIDTVVRCDTRHVMRGDQVESLQCGTDKGFLKHEADHTRLEASSLKQMKHVSGGEDLQSSSLSVTMISGDQEENMTADSNLVASLEESLGKGDALTSAELSRTVDVQQAADSDLFKSISVEVKPTCSKENVLEESHLWPSEICQGISSAIENDTQLNSRAIPVGPLEGINDEFGNDADSKDRNMFGTTLSEQLAGAQVLESPLVTNNMMGGTHEKVSEDRQSQPSYEGKEMGTMLDDDARVNLGAVSVGHLKRGNAIASFSQEARYEGEMVPDKNLIISVKQSELSQSKLGMMDGSRSSTREDNNHSYMGERLPTTGEQEIFHTNKDCQPQELQGIEKPAINSSETSETLNVKERGMQLYNDRKYDENVLMFVPTAIGNVIRSVSQTLKKLFKG